jgi:hypothetical protein
LAAAAAPPQGLEAAHRAIRADRSLQWDFAAAPLEPERSPPGWLSLFDALGPLLQLVFWGGLAVMAVLAIWFAAREGERRWRARRPRTARAVPAVQPPSETRARALMAEADRLAAEGRFAEAVHVLLFRGVDDIRDQRPELFRRALTSREIAALSALPERARAEFGRIAAVVERSFFGGRPVDAGSFAECRRAYEAFAAPASWSAR